MEIYTLPKHISIDALLERINAATHLEATKTEEDLLEIDYFDVERGSKWSNDFVIGGIYLEDYEPQLGVPSYKARRFRANLRIENMENTCRISFELEEPFFNYWLIAVVCILLGFAFQLLSFNSLLPIGLGLGLVALYYVARRINQNVFIEQIKRVVYSI